MNDRKSMHQAELIQMIADHMEKGFLDNIIDMFRHDSALYSLLPDLILDERIRVRLGTTALIESLKDEEYLHLRDALPSLLPLLEHENETVRGDSAYILGFIGDGSVLEKLHSLLHDPNRDVREIAQEAISDIEKREHGGR